MHVRMHVCIYVLMFVIRPYIYIYHAAVYKTKNTFVKGLTEVTTSNSQVYSPAVISSHGD